MSERLKIVPSISSFEARARHPIDLWMLFARRFQRHPFVRSLVIARDAKKGCPWCNKPFAKLDTTQVHHIDYDHHCQFAGRVEIPTPTAKRPNRKFKGPDCERCRITNSDAFTGCMSRVILVHGLCNSQIEEIRIRQM